MAPNHETTVHPGAWRRGVTGAFETRRPTLFVTNWRGALVLGRPTAAGSSRYLGTADDGS